MLVFRKWEGLLGRALFFLDELIHNVQVLLNSIKCLRVAGLPLSANLSCLVLTMQVSDQVDVGCYTLRIKPTGTRVSLGRRVP